MVLMVMSGTRCSPFHCTHRTHVLVSVRDTVDINCSAIQKLYTVLDVSSNFFTMSNKRKRTFPKQLPRRIFTGLMMTTRKTIRNHLEKRSVSPKVKGAARRACGMTFDVHLTIKSVNSRGCRLQYYNLLPPPQSYRDKTFTVPPTIASGPLGFAFTSLHPFTVYSSRSQIN